MESRSDDEEPLPPSFFEGRFLIEVLSWDWPLYLGISSKRVPRKYTFQGGLDYVRTMEIAGRILAPTEYRGQTIRLHISPFGSEVRFGRGGWDRVGWLYFPSSEMNRRGYSATLMTPEAEMTALAIRLSQQTKYIHIWTFGSDLEQASIDRYDFSSYVPPKLKSWAGME